MTSVNSHHNPMSYSYYSHFLDEGTEAYKSYTSPLNTQLLSVVRNDLKTIHSDISIFGYYTIPYKPIISALLFLLNVFQNSMFNYLLVLE